MPSSQNSLTQVRIGVVQRCRWPNIAAIVVPGDQLDSGLTENRSYSTVFASRYYMLCSVYMFRCFRIVCARLLNLNSKKRLKYRVGGSFETKIEEKVFDGYECFVVFSLFVLGY